MQPNSANLDVSVERISAGMFTAANSRGGQITVGSGGGADFTPTELMLVAVAGCTAIDVDILTSRRSEPGSFRVEADGKKVREADGNRLTDIRVTYRITFPDGEQGDAARAILPDVVKKSHDRLGTVSRTIQVGTPVTTRIE